VSGAEPEVLFARHGRLGRITLNRPGALNALTLGMAEAMDAQLRNWAEDGAIAAVFVTGAGEKAFCAGGDIRALYDSGTTPGDSLTREFYRVEYRLDRLIKRYPKPYVATIDGVVMGGGAGISVHGSHRVETERTLFAMPETGIGLFPDVGGSYFLPRLPGRIGCAPPIASMRVSRRIAFRQTAWRHWNPNWPNPTRRSARSWTDSTNLPAPRPWPNAAPRSTGFSPANRSRRSWPP
jgi:hypothetical protein